MSERYIALCANINWPDWISAVSALAVAIISALALGTWKSQLIGHSKFDFSRELRSATLKVNREISMILRLPMPIQFHPDFKLERKPDVGEKFKTYIARYESRINEAFELLELTLAAGKVRTKEWATLKEKVKQMGLCVSAVTAAIHTTEIMLDYQPESLIEIFGSDFTDPAKLLFSGDNNLIRADFIKRLNDATTNLINFADQYSPE